MMKNYIDYSEKTKTLAENLKAKVKSQHINAFQALSELRKSELMTLNDAKKMLGLE